MTRGLHPPGLAPRSLRRRSSWARGPTPERKRAAPAMTATRPPRRPTTRASCTLRSPRRTARAVTSARLRQKLILQSPEPELCAKCHAEVKAPAGAGSDHLHQQGVSCSSCHDPHASNTKGLLREPAAGPDGGAPAASPGGPGPRPPAPPATCASRPPSPRQTAPAVCIWRLRRVPWTHAAPEKQLLIAPRRNCAPAATMSRSSSRNCTRGRRWRRILLFLSRPARAPKSGTKAAAFIHQPYAEANCTACHGGLPRIPRSSPRQGRAVHHLPRRSGHGSGRRPRACPGGRRDCLFCHAPHQAERGGLLRGDAEALCVPCHQDAREQAKLASVHTPFKLLECGECHQPHTGAAGLLRQSDPALCTRCHRRAGEDPESHGAAPARAGSLQHLPCRPRQPPSTRSSNRRAAVSASAATARSRPS